MPIINFSNPTAILIGVVLFLLVLYLARETKKAWVIGIMLFVFLGLLIGHTVEFATIAKESREIYNDVIASAAMDLIFIFLSFITYLWVDDIEAKANNLKSVDNSLDWFWKEV